MFSLYEQLPEANMESILLFTGIQCGIHTCINRNTVRIHRKTSLPGLESIKKGRKLFAYGSLEPMLISSYYYYYYFYFPSLVLKAYYRKTTRDIKKQFSQKVQNCSRAILSIVFMISFHRVFMTLTKRWFWFVYSVPENWSVRISWNFFSRYLRHMSMSERSIFEISGKLKSGEFFEKCVRPVFKTLFCKNT